MSAVELLVDEAAEEFGEDPCVPDVRQALDDTKERLGRLRADGERFVGEFALEEPDEALVDEVRKLMDRELRLEW